MLKKQVKSDTSESEMIEETQSFYNRKMNCHICNVKIDYEEESLQIEVDAADFSFIDFDTWIRQRLRLKSGECVKFMLKDTKKGI